MVFEVSYLKNVCKCLKIELGEPNERFDLESKAFILKSLQDLMIFAVLIVILFGSHSVTPKGFTYVSFLEPT